MKSPLECIKAIKTKAGDDFPIIVRISGDEPDPYSRTLTETFYIVHMLEKARVAAIEVSGGSCPANGWHVVPVNGLPMAINADYAEAIKKKTKLPVLVVGNIRTPEMGEYLLEPGVADIMTCCGCVGCEVTEYLAGRFIRPFTKGRTAVTVVEMLESLATGLDFGTMAHHADLPGEYGVNVYLNSKVKEITNDGLVLDVNGKEEVLTGMNNIILAMGSKPYDTLSVKLKEIVPEVYVIGDAKEARTAMEATHMGTDVGRLV